MLRLVALGGLGEIGLNAMIFESGGERLLVDCGLMFPADGMPGVEIVLPDFGWLLSDPASLKGVVLTHGHEDHIGALPYLLQRKPMPVWGTRLTLGLLKHRLDELSVTADLRELTPRERIAVGSRFQVEAIRVTHSVPDGVGLIVQAGGATVVHTGDFKLDDAPVDGKHTDLQRLGEVGDVGVDCLLSDSTNSEFETRSGDEREVRATFERLFARARGRIIASMFASNLNRIQQLVELCELHGRKLVLNGRSMLRNVEIAKSLGYLRLPEGLLIGAEELSMFAPSRLCVLTTGSQAEPRSGLSLMAGDEERDLMIARGDLVLLSSRTIPGNERAVTGLIDRLFARGAEVIYARVEPGVHVTGHATAPEQRQMIQTVRPKNFVPIHGELRQLHRHLATAREAGVRGEGLLLARDGDVLAFRDGRVQLDGRVPVGRVFRDRFAGGEILPPSLREREQLAETGVVVASVVLDSASARVVSGPHLSGRGLSEDELLLLPRAAAESKAFFEELSPALRSDEALVREELTRAVRRVFKQHTQKRPTVLPVIVRL